MEMENRSAGINVKNKGREEQLQFLRFLAFLNVFIAHAEQWLFFPYRASHSASAAVSFFFMLSGVVAGYAAMGNQNIPTIHNAAVFLWRKIRKIYPLYFLTTMFTVIFSEIPQLILQCDFAGVIPQIMQLGKNLLLIQSWFPENAHSFNTVGWFLSVLIFLYGLTLPFARLMDKLAQCKYRVILVLGMFGGIFCAIVFYCYFTQMYDMAFWHYQFPPARAGEYLLGMMMGYFASAVKEKIPRGKMLKISCTVLEIGVLWFWYYSLSRPGNYWRNNIVSWVIPNMLVLAVYLVGQGWISQLFRRKKLVHLGDISFECYLLHQVILIRFANNLAGQPISVPGQIFVFLFSLLFSILTAYYLHGRTVSRKNK